MLGLLNVFRRNVIGNPEVSRPLSQKVYRSLLMLYTAPFGRGNKITIDRYTGVVQQMDLWYLKLKSQNKCVFIPTSFIYDKTIEVYE
ncbi:hypothetical protein PAPHI01_0879 [Pancytospora philotis]|nr:hypothetical protein PAPHI01_0879 [Pancytospora philotis]